MRIFRHWVQGSVYAVPVWILHCAIAIDKGRSQKLRLCVIVGYSASEWRSRNRSRLVPSLTRRSLSASLAACRKA
jgi:hypothetical protein